MEILESFAKEKIIPVIKIDDAADTLPLMDAIEAGGVHVAEITYRSAAGPEALRIAAQYRPNMIIGAGTILNLSQAEDAVEKGAKFIVSPGFEQWTCDYVMQKDILYMPGAITPTEMMGLAEKGVKLIKFFPAEAAGGINLLKALVAPFPTLKFVPTGGINEKNFMNYLSLPQIVAIGGSWMVQNEYIKNKNWAKITQLVRTAREMVNSVFHKEG